MIEFDKIVDKENFKLAHEQTLLGDTKYTKEAIEFNRDAVVNLENLRLEVESGTYQFGEYYEFVVKEPKERLIHAPSYRDKIVQCAINNVMKEYYFPKFIKDSYSCIDDKGTLACADRISEFMAKAKWMYGEQAHIVKIDIKKFFYSIDRKIMKALLSAKIKCKKSLELIFKIIDSARKISKLGLPLGNTISQICANIYMDVVDQFEKDECQ
jgi:retron-type reverse transcriptase